MTISQAINLLKPYLVTREALKKSYRDACKTYHPDVNPDGLEMMKMVNQAMDLLTEKWGEWDLRDRDSKDANFATEIMDALTKIRTWPGLVLEVCGTWLWVSGMTHHKLPGSSGAQTRQPGIFIHPATGSCPAGNGGWMR